MMCYRYVFATKTQANPIQHWWETDWRFINYSGQAFRLDSSTDCCLFTPVNVADVYHAFEIALNLLSSRKLFVIAS